MPPPPPPDKKRIQSHWSRSPQLESHSGFCTEIVLEFAKRNCAEGKTIHHCASYITAPP